MKINVLVTLFLLTSACASSGGTTAFKAKSGASVTHLKPVYFEVGSDDIEDLQTISSNAQWLKSHPKAVVVLEGHCDERGDREYNTQLGDRRARAVMHALIQKGVPETQLILMSYGKDKPASNQSNSDALAENRRVSFVLR